jgi:hypothetical protein
MSRREPPPIGWEPIDRTNALRGRLGAGVVATIAPDASGWWWSVTWPATELPPLLPDGPKRRGRRPSRSGHASSMHEAKGAALRASTEGRP